MPPMPTIYTPEQCFYTKNPVPAETLPTRKGVCPGFFATGKKMKVAVESPGGNFAIGTKNRATTRSKARRELPLANSHRAFTYQ